MSKKSLGRGLGALITERETESSQIREIMLSDIFPNPDQPRSIFDENKLNELADSIREHGLLQPILVKPEGNRYYIIAGERRFRASKLAGLDRISCIVRDCTEQEMTERALIENIQRADLSPVEEGLAYSRLIEEYGLTQDQVAKRVGKGRPTIANLLRIIQLPTEILEFLHKEQLSLGHAKVLLGINDIEKQISMAKHILENNTSVRETENLIHTDEQSTPAVNKRPPRPNKEMPEYSPMQDIEDKLRIALQTKVKIKGNEEKGKIEIEYFCKEELSRILEDWKVDI